MNTSILNEFAISGIAVMAIVFGAVAFALLIAVIILGITLYKKIKILKNSKAEDVYIKDGVRYTKDSRSSDAGNVSVTHNEGDKVLERGKIYTVGKNDELLPGKYTVLASGENAPNFNMRIGGLVREYAHNSNIVLSEGDKVAAVSHSVVLR